MILQKKECPKKLFKGDREYILIKQYSRYGLYQDVKSKMRECFTFDELKMLPDFKPVKYSNYLINPNKVKR